MSSTKALRTWERVDLIPRQAALFPEGLYERPKVRNRVYLPPSASPTQAVHGRDLFDQIMAGAEVGDSIIPLVDDLKLPSTAFHFKPPYLKGYRDLYEYFDATGAHANNYLTYANGRLYVSANSRICGPLPWDYEPEAQAYWDAVTKLDQTEAGARANKLVAHLIETYLNKRRLDTWERFRYFDVSFCYWNKDSDEPLATTGPRYTVRFQTEPAVGMFVIKRGQKPYVKRSKRFGNKLATSSRMSFCLHPEKPYPSGDLIAMQFMICVTHGIVDFMEQANW